MLAQIVSGEVDVADILYLVAAILFGVAAFVQRSDGPSVVALLGFMAIALGLLVR